MRLGLAGPALVAAVGLWTPVAAERLQPDFTFRRVGVPQAGSTNRIGVQIDPNAQSAIRPPNSAFEGSAAAAPEVALVASAPALPESIAAAARPSGYEWFWAAVSPRLGENGAARVLTALRTLESPPAGGGATAPRLQALQSIAEAHGREIMRHTVGTRVSPALVVAVIAVESSGSATAVSPAGAAGLMQLMPATAERFNVQDRSNPSESIRGGVLYLDWLMGHFDGDPILALAGYNAGEGAVRNNGGVPPYAETRAYVPKVLAAWRVARGLCQTPPELVTDPCVFAVNNL